MSPEQQRDAGSAAQIHHGGEPPPVAGSSAPSGAGPIVVGGLVVVPEAQAIVDAKPTWSLGQSQRPSASAAAWSPMVRLSGIVSEQLLGGRAST